MTFEIALRRSRLLPSFIQYGDDEPRPVDKAHFVGQKKAQDISGKHNQGGKNENEPRPGKYDERGYRQLNSITLGEVKSAYEFYKHQLMPTHYSSFIATNHFYMLDLAQREKNIPAAVFGRVNVLHPGDGQILNIKEMELLFPNKEGKPEKIDLHHRDFLPHGNVQSYCIRVKFLGTEEDMQDFVGFENMFFDQGFAFDFQQGYLDLINLATSKRDTLPWFHVIGSRWFASIPYSMQEEVRSSLKKLIEWNSLILNYHPDHTPYDVHSLNRELGFQYGFTKIVLIEPRDPTQVLQVIQPTFEKIFDQPIK
jgi:hypothetical protein